jgi:3-deoxy-D-manno-octulosonate 8-phosphate phosphatase (KDO 8-P phosphatase)
VEHEAQGLAAAFRRAKLLVLDVDGTLTDGRIAYFDHAGGVGELLSFDVRDGLGLQSLARAGVVVALVTGRGSPALERRAGELKLRLLQRVADKRAALEELQAELGVAPSETIAMGDDLPDLGLAERAAVLVAPPDAVDEVKRRAQLVVSRPAGRGAVRDLCERVLAAREIGAR